MPHIIFHTFIASKISKDPRFIFGNIFPDSFELLKINQKQALNFTKNLAKRKEYVPFYRGIQLHFLIDDYFHPSYIDKKSTELQKRAKPLKLSYASAHFLVELALDRMILKKNKHLKKLMIEANNFYSTKNFSYYLSDYFKKDQKKILEMLNDSSNFVELAVHPSIKNTIKTLKILKKYFPGELKSNLQTAIGMTLLLKIANKLVKKDYEEQIEKVIVLAKKRGF